MMKKLLIAIIAIMVASPTFAQEAENYIQVTGNAELEITPNEFFLSITLDESDSKGRQAIELQRKQLISTLKSLGINIEKQLTMANMSSSYFKRNNSLAVAKYQLQLSSSEMVIKVYDALSEINISAVRIERISHSDIEELTSQVRKDAMVNAKTIATELATAIGQSVGACIYIYDGNRGVTPTYYNDGIVMRAMAKSSNEALPEEEPIEFKKIKLSYSVNAKFRLNE